MTANAPPRERTRARPKFGPELLAALVMGASIETIAAQHGLTTKRVEKLLRDELRKRWVAPAQDYGRLQIARLETILAKLSLQAAEGDVKAIDRILRVLDRLDRYYGFGKLAPPSPAFDEDARAKLFERINRAANYALPPPPKEGA